ncbi:MAG: prepilin-type N-terminal cleavage/methylation domain-containing protein [Candidatus Omnitrophica bacterium]|nr:prepilin-type N-terminal cleavage/methylation domain-containing protein [Candidatus Omnitrophota bacterium]
MHSSVTSPARARNKAPSTSSFTLIELTIVLTIIGILAAIAIPRYINLVNEAKLSTTKGILGNVRSAVMIVHAKEIIQGRNSFPTLEDVQDNPFNTGSSVLETGDLPPNPFSTGPDKDAVVLTVGRPNPTGTDGAWAYDSVTGGFYANTKSGQGEELL